MRHFMVDPDNEERLLKVPPHVVKAIKREALDAAREAVRGFLIGDTDCDRRYWEVIDAIDALKENP